MPKLSENVIPKHRKHGKWGLIVLSGQAYHTGVYGTPEAEREMNRQVADWIARGRCPKPESDGLTVRGLADAYTAYAMKRFVKRGEPTTYACTCKCVGDHLKKFAGDKPAAGFGPIALAGLRSRWLAAGEGRGPMTRRTVGGYTTIVLEMFRWAVGRELIPESVYRQLKCIDPLTHRDGGKASVPVTSAPADSVEAVIAELRKVPAAILRLMLLTGMRPAEACSIRPCDLDRTSSPWLYRVTQDWNKMEHQDKSRAVYIGPKAQAVLLPFLENCKPKDPVFRPLGLRRHLSYKPNSLYTLVRQTIGRLGVDYWHPNQLRHNALTGIRRAMTLEHAKSVGGHSSAKTTAIYIDPDVLGSDDREAARQAALAMG